MADALVSPAVGGTMWAATTGVILYSARKIQTEHDEQKVPLMGVLGAFIFAAQMINFAIPGTGSSGHLGGGLLLAILLGPYAGFITMASILTIQALFFADGGLLALGCNIFNLGFFACFITYPLIYRPLVKRNLTQNRIFWSITLAAVLGLQLGSLSVVLETLFSGISELPFLTFGLLMQSIHLVIGIAEGSITATVVSFVWKARPELIENTVLSKPIGNISLKKVCFGLLAVALFTGGILSWFASTYPDGLEWSVIHTSGEKELTTQSQVHRFLSLIQEKTAILSGFGFKKNQRPGNTGAKKDSSRTVADGDKGLAGVLGTALTLVLAGLVGVGLRFFKKWSRGARGNEQD